MSKRRRVHGSDPRRLGGDIIDRGGGPHARAGVIVDTTRAILLDHCTVSTVDAEHTSDPEHHRSLIAMALSGRINRSTDRAKVLFLFGTDGAAAIITELLALAGRAGVDLDQFLADMDGRLAVLREHGNLSPREDT